MAQKIYSLEEFEIKNIIPYPYLVEILFIAEKISLDESFLAEDLVKECGNNYHFSRKVVSDALVKLIHKGYVYRKNGSKKLFLRQEWIDTEREILVSRVKHC